MADHVPIAIFGDEGQRRYPPAIGSNSTDKANLDRFRTSTGGVGEWGCPGLTDT
jgi:hypothetical protein